jgi:hypothetical protein
MQVIYAVGKPGHLDFYVTDRREAVPAGAITFAICTATNTIENVDEDVFDAITDQEYFTIKAMIYEAMRSEAAKCRTRHPAAQSTLEISVSRFLRWLSNSPDGGRSSSLSKHPSNC